MTTETPVKPPEDDELAAARWDLEPLVDGGGPEAVIALMDSAKQRADAFAAKHRGKVAQLDAAGFAAALRELEGISDEIGRGASYAALRFSVDTQSPEVGALLQQVQERGAAIETELLFFDLEWNEVDDESAEMLIESDELAFCRHYLRELRKYRPHLLTEPEERILTETSVTGRSAFARLFTEQISAVSVPVPDADEPVELMVALSRLQSPDRDLRRDTAAAVTEALEPGLRTRAFIFNTLLADKATKDRLRSYEHWLASRNLANEASDESVAALIDAVTGRYEIARRWYRLKAQLLGLDRLAHYDRMAPLALDERTIAYADARELVLDCYRGFSPELGAVAEEFFTGSYIDAPPEPGKRGGAFCSYTVPSRHPYVMLNYTSRPGDVLTMAHELGHGVHASLSRPRGVFEFGTPLTVAETASIFGESIVLGRLLGEAPDAKARLGLLAESLDGYVGAVFRQIAMNRFEDRVHTERRMSGELSIDAYKAAWLDTQKDLLGDSVDVTDDYGSWWSYVPHFIDTPGYVYAYAYGNLLALSVYRRYEEEGEGFVGSYLELLRAGGSRPPEGLGEIVGVDLTDPGFWNAGLDLIERRLDEAEAVAAQA
jgi:oligoendopeptidase F